MFNFIFNLFHIHTFKRITPIFSLIDQTEIMYVQCSHCKCDKVISIVRSNLPKEIRSAPNYFCITSLKSKKRCKREERKFWYSLEKEME